MKIIGEHGFNVVRVRSPIIDFEIRYGTLILKKAKVTLDDIAPFEKKWIAESSENEVWVAKLGGGFKVYNQFSPVGFVFHKKISTVRKADQTRQELSKLKPYYLEKYSFRCRRCHKSFSSRKLHLHHIRPLARGGTNEEKNIVVLCQTCHIKEHRNILSNEKADKNLTAPVNG